MLHFFILSFFFSVEKRSVIKYYWSARVIWRAQTVWKLFHCSSTGTIIMFHKYFWSISPCASTEETQSHNQQHTLIWNICNRVRADKNPPLQDCMSILFPFSCAPLHFIFFPSFRTVTKRTKFYNMLKYIDDETKYGSWFSHFNRKSMKRIERCRLKMYVLQKAARKLNTKRFANE